MQRVAMLTPMELELAPIVRRLGLERDGSVHRGRAGDVEVVALLTNMGMAAGAEGARRAVEHDVDVVMVVGVAGGVDIDALSIGDVIVPEIVVDRATGGVFRPTHTGDITPHGTLSCGDDLITDPPTLAAMAAEGVVAVDMETAAVAAACEDAGCAWAVFRGISDFAGEGLVDDALFAMQNPDGTTDPDALSRYLAEHPERLAVLQRLAHDAALATEAAAAAAIRACARI